MKIAIASGKGGTGKTTLSLNLARALGREVALLDCDVEEPNAHLFLRGRTLDEEIVSLPVPEVDADLCDGCGACAQFCQYNAIASFGKRVLVFPDMCHGCGGCMRVCPTGAIHEVDRRIGVVETVAAGKITLIQGRLDIGMSVAPPLIRALQARQPDGIPAVIDAPPGTSCPVVAALRGADIVLLITEPTPFGLHDLELAVAMTQELGIPFGVVVNRMGIGDDRVQDFCRRRRIPILAEIPDDRRIAEAYSRGDILVDVLPEYRELFLGLLERVFSMKGVGVG